ncbi:conserved hypothetical protein [Flavobacterium sp. 9AF]|uniref:polysaccharide pyruvyl transferase family protein n=1 Tax=Flavobacterium sp. 9AF TaxID=2653142 RepID=UPI0012F43468|nr:polysaccharide pyruvyl transferase family protein [Flavobacterium sp. 9AF]VXB50481.1 conserved hypothetical protein [Flavobacterium sp. 9AF]
MNRTQIGLLNFHFSNNNYGAVLQTYALQQALEAIGYYAENIDLKPKTYWKSKIVEMILGKPFEKFRNKYLNISDRSFFQVTNDFKEYTYKYPALIVGSDQVWRPSYCEFPKAYFLDFAQETQIKVSYAASFGIDYWENNAEIDSYKELISLFHAVSVREDSGVTLCRNIFNVEAMHVLDPTLLVDKRAYDALLIQKKDTERKIVYYKLDQDQDFVESIAFLSEKLNVTSEDIYYEEKKILGKTYKKFKSVSNWISAIANAELVVTDSYHCVCFALIFEKNFVYYINKNNRGLTRIQSLLGLLNLEDKIVSSLDEIKEKFRQDSNNINYSDINKKIATLKNISYHFLKEALNKIK